MLVQKIPSIWILLAWFRGDHHRRATEATGDLRSPTPQVSSVDGQNWGRGVLKKEVSIERALRKITYRIGMDLDQENIYIV